MRLDQIRALSTKERSAFAPLPNVYPIISVIFVHRDRVAATASIEVAIRPQSKES
jgi:hypothetical protein